MNTLTARLADHGWRMTAQRRVIAGVFDALGGTHVHLTAEEVLTRAADVLPEISRATVYNTLSELVDAGELVAVNIGDRVTRYDPNVAQRHSHLVCRSCGTILDLPMTAVEPPAVVAATGFSVEEAEVIYRGLCAACTSS